MKIDLCKHSRKIFIERFCEALPMISSIKIAVVKFCYVA